MRRLTKARISTISLVALYVVFSVLAAACQVDRMSPAAGHHHHGQTHHSGLHTVLCALACQANGASDLVSSVPDLRPVRLFLGTTAVSFFPGRLMRQDGLRTRAPPILPALA